jgi:hypothetical protein
MIVSIVVNNLIICTCTPVTSYKRPPFVYMCVHDLTLTHVGHQAITLYLLIVINIGFVSPTKVGNTIDNRIQVGTLSGQLQDDIALRLKLTLEYLSTGELIITTRECKLCTMQ